MAVTSVINVCDVCHLSVACSFVVAARCLERRETLMKEVNNYLGCCHAFVIRNRLSQTVVLRAEILSQAQLPVFNL